MPDRQLFINLPVSSLDRSVKFFKELGFEFVSELTNETAACMSISGSAFAMLVSNSRFSDFTPKIICNARERCEAIIAVSADSKEEVDALYDKAMALGASKVRDPEDHAFMYGRSFNDLDGHVWEVFWMDLPD
ncbi:MAG: glyoxalase/bleomycin resistance/extradiol dioxygenase family protein [Acidobacteria bacterium]|nr:MAG: glyoxalase/bleomycin resistance/extradiol dioxygenase family protein [Acidobacteriota bacterium]